MQSTDGSSQPSVRSMELHSTLPFGASWNHERVSALSWLWPFTSLAWSPLASHSSRNLCAVAMRGRKTTVFLSEAYSASLAAMSSRYGSMAEAHSRSDQSPPRGAARAMLTGRVSAWMRHSQPSSMARLMVISKAMFLYTEPRFRLSPRSAVAVTPSTLASGKWSRTRM